MHRLEPSRKIRRGTVRQLAGHAGTRALVVLLAGGFASVPAAGAVTLSEKARESGCVSKPSVVDGNTYRCVTESGAFSYFNVPGAPAPPRLRRRRAAAASPRRRPPDFPRSTARRRRAATTSGARSWATNSRARRSSSPKPASRTPTARRRRCPRSGPAPTSTARASRGCARRSPCTSATSRRCARKSATRADLGGRDVAARRVACATEFTWRRRSGAPRVLPWCSAAAASPSKRARVQPGRGGAGCRDHGADIAIASAWSSRPSPARRARRSGS